MQKVNREQLVEKAAQLLSNGVVSSVLGWSKGEFDYDITPTLFKDASSLEKNFVYSDFCGVNLTKYLVSKTKETDGKILVFFTILLSALS